MRFSPLFLVVVALVGSAPAQEPVAPTSTQWREDFVAKDPITRELARRRLAVGKTLPVAALAEMLKDGPEAAAVAAATLLRDRHPRHPALRAVPVADTPTFRAVLPVAATATLVRIVANGPDPLRVAALFELEDRGELTDGMLAVAVTSTVEELAVAACQVMVFERSPFPVGITKGLADADARRRLLRFLADRPRRAALPFVRKILAEPKIDAVTRILAISALPPELLDTKYRRYVLTAAAGRDLAVGNRARIAAARFPPALADQIVPIALLRVDAGVPVHLLLPCLERISKQGERLLLEHALQANDTVQSDLFHWLDARDSKLIAGYVGRALDGKRPFPAGLLRLVAPILNSRARIARVVELLGAKGAAELAYTALLDAKVYHPEMLAYAEADIVDANARRLRRLLRLPRSKLPTAVFEFGLDSDSQIAALYTLNSLARAPIPRKLERTVLGYAESALNPQLQMAAIRALVLHGSESAGRKAWSMLRKAERLDLGYRWLMERPKPWNHEILLKERERLARDPRARADWHRVLITLAKLGDRGARETLLAEIPRLAPSEMRELQLIMRKALKPADLVALADRYLEVKPPDPKDEDAFHPEDDRRVELLEWLLRQKSVDLGDRLLALWKGDRSYDVKLHALRGLLARESKALHAEIGAELGRPFDEDRQELAFEIVGSMTDVPIPKRNLELLAQIVLQCPLSAPRREVGLALRSERSNARRIDYPLITPAVNLLRLDGQVRPQAAFRGVAGRLGGTVVALNRQRLGRFLTGLARRESLLTDLGPLVAELLLRAPDLGTDYVGAAQMVLADAAAAEGEFVKAAILYESALRAFARGVVPESVRRAFFGVTDPANGYHPMAALAARSAMARAQARNANGATDAAFLALGRARDLAEGDAATIEEIRELETTFGR